MTSQFDMNQPPRICQICAELHSLATQCKYDRLVQVIHSRNKQLAAQQHSIVQMYNRLREFQALIQQMTPMLERLHKIEEKYLELTGGEHGTEDVQTATPEQLALEGV